MGNVSTKTEQAGRLKGVYADGKSIRGLRLEKEWQQKKLASEAKVTLRTLQRAEEGKTRLDLGILRNIANALGVDRDRIVVADPAEEQLTLRVRPSHEQIRLSPTTSADEILKFGRWGWPSRLPS
jgi:transcriptional regulator with XRE-family HTH domain